MSLEIERKYLNVDFDKLRERLVLCRAQGGIAHFESNLVFETKDSTLFNQGKLLRLRTQEWENGVEHILTLKKPATENEAFKIREEIESPVVNVHKMSAILFELGFVVQARYEKVREAWHYKNVEIVLDSLPFIRVVELEGTTGDIYMAERDLHLDTVEKSTDSYHALHQAWLEARCLPKTPGFTFGEQERTAWRKKLGIKSTGG